jgi:hypothetical protein
VSVYYFGRDRRRHYFPTTTVMGSWSLQIGGMMNVREDAPACRDRVYEMPDADLASIPLGRNVFYRPGSVMTGITTDPRFYVVGRHGVLHWVESGVVPPLAPAEWIGDRAATIPDVFFVNYSIGVQYSPATYDAASEYATTIDDDLEL